MSAKTFTIDDLQAHKSRESLYLLLSGKVYDVTQFLDEVRAGSQLSDRGSQLLLAGSGRGDEIERGRWGCCLRPTSSAVTSCCPDHAQHTADAPHRLACTPPAYLVSGPPRLPPPRCPLLTRLFGLPLTPTAPGR